MAAPSMGNGSRGSGAAERLLPGLFRGLFLAAGACYVVAVVLNLLSIWYATSPTEERRARAIRLGVARPSVWSEEGRRLLFSGAPDSSVRAREAVLQAARMNPLDPSNWTALGAISDQEGDIVKSEAARRARLAAAPRNPAAAWALANFLIIQGRAGEALPYLQGAAAADARQRSAVYDLGWKILEDAHAVLREVVPREPAARAAYLDYLVYREKLAEAEQVWPEIQSDVLAADRDAAARYALKMAQKGLGRGAGRAWGDLVAAHPSHWRAPEGEFVHNGDFEMDFLRGGLEWQIPRCPCEIGLDTSVFRSGTRSLRVVFDRKANLSFQLGQLVPVEPGRRYRLRAFLRTENITSNSGMRFEVRSVPLVKEELFAQSAQNLVGTNPWTPVEMEFRTGPSTSVVSIRLYRVPSQRLNNILLGKVWLDEVSIRAIE